MNQGIPFARTLRALDADDFRTSKLGLVLAVAMLAAWVWWALAARIPQYEHSSNVRLDPIGQTAAAYFPSDTRIGQRAIVSSKNSAIDAQVIDSAPTTDGQIRVTLRLFQPAAEPLTADIETERISPATIALRAAGLANR